jgi:hypothetical protein
MPDALANFLLPRAALGNEDDRRRAVRFVTFALTMLFWVPVFTATYFILDAPISGSVIGAAGVLVVAVLAIYRATIPSSAASPAGMVRLPRGGTRRFPCWRSRFPAAEQARFGWRSSSCQSAGFTSRISTTRRSFRN